MKISDFQNGTYAVGKVVGVASARVEGARTRPPERYTEHALLEDMTKAHKFAADPSEREVLAQISGIGTSRTRGPTVANLIDREMLVRQQVPGARGKKKTVLVSSPRAREIARALPALLTSVATTAKWELGFRMVEDGRATPQQLQAHLDRVLHVIVDDARGRVARSPEPPAAGGSGAPAVAVSRAAAASGRLPAAAAGASGAAAGDPGRTGGQQPQAGAAPGHKPPAGPAAGSLAPTKTPIWAVARRGPFGAQSVS